MVQTFLYPILAYPPHITALNLEKTARVEGTVLGIKGQYLLLDTSVLILPTATSCAFSTW